MRYALRSLARSPGFVAIAVVALGVGLGLSTTMFAVLDAVTHPYVAYREPETLFSINWWFGRRNPMSGPELYRFLRDNTRSFEAVIPVERWGQITLHSAAGDQDIGLTRVSQRYFTVTGVRVARGRPFTEADGPDVAIVSHDLWRRFLAGRREIAGATVAMGDRTYAVVGVMPVGATGTSVWLPSSPGIEAGAVQAGNVRPMVRLRPGVTRDLAQAELKRLADLLSARFGAREAPFAFELVPSVDRREELRDIQKAMVGAALLVLLIACVNLAHLMLARGLAKRRELALRMALGASRRDVVGQMFAECAVITLAGAALGIVITLWGAGYLQNRMPREVAWVGLVRPQLSWRVFALSSTAAALSAVLFGLLPAIRVAFAVDVNDPLKDDSGTTTGRVRNRYSPLVICEVAVALVLMMGGALLLRTLQVLQREHLSFETRTLYRGAYYRHGATDSASGVQRRQDILGTARAADGVTAVAFQSWHRVDGGGITPERTGDSTRIIHTTGYWAVTPNYARVLGLPVLQGRDFYEGDAGGTGVAIIDPLAAQRLYPTIANPVGRMIKLGGPASNARWVLIVGVMRSPSVLESRDRDAGWPTVIVAEFDTVATGQLLVRTRTTEPRILTELQSRLKAATGATGYFYPYDYQRRAELVSRGFLATVFVAMGAVALGLAALGLYGVLAYAVNRRMREFAVRIALGADPRMLWRMVLHDGFVMLLAGTGVGAFGALAAARMLDAVLVAVLPSDVVSLVVCEAVLLAAGFAALIQPARRAARANPMDILRAV